MGFMISGGISKEMFYSIIGLLLNLNTVEKSNIVNAINEVLAIAEESVNFQGSTTVQALIGQPSETFNPHKGYMYNIMSDYTYNGNVVVRHGDDIMATGEYSSSVDIPVYYGETSKTLFIHGYEFDVSSGPVDLSGYVTTAQLGDLTDLDTTAKNNIVAALNEVRQNATTAYHYKGTVPVSGIKASIEHGYIPVQGDVYDSPTDYQYNGQIVVRAGDNIAYVGVYDQSKGTEYAYPYLYIAGYAFDVLSGIIDISVKQDKTTISSDTTSQTANIEMENNTEKRFSTLTSLTLTLPSTIPDDYISSVVFTSGNNATNLVYPSAMKWASSSFVSDGVFVPTTNTRYELNLKYEGAFIVGVVGGVETT